MARQLGDKIEQENDPEIQEQVLELIETVLVYKFPKLTRQEIEAMFTYSDLKQTRVYQDAKEEGEQRGLVKGQATMLLRLLNRKFGQISPSFRDNVNKLSAN
jgi:predicted transposase YdaD